MSLFAELKRRRVLRVAGAYLVGAWVILQVADIVFPALGLPEWTLKLIVTAVILGFPLALLLGWAFDLTPGGIERTPATVKLAFPVRAAAIGTLIVATGVLGFVVMRRRAVASNLDAKAVAILPFRVLGDANLLLMREGMVDLLSAKLTGGSSMHAIDSRTTLALWRKTVASEKDDLGPRDALKLARRLGAGNVLLGEMIGTPNEIVMNVKLYSAVHGAVVENVEEKASPNDVLKLVDRVVTRLLSARAGEGHRAAALLSESLPAVRSYLDGARLYRLGSQDSAAARFNAALAEDSTFALAGLYLSLARAWTGYGPDYNRGRHIAWTHRERLPQRDRDFVNALLGEDFPAPQSAYEQVRSFERVTDKYPDMVDAWHIRGDRYYHLGPVADLEKPIDKAMEAWSRALALDSTYAPALEHQPVIYAARGDTANLRRVAKLMYDRILPGERLTASGAYVAALGLHDEKWLSEVRASLPKMSRFDVSQSVLNTIVATLPQQDMDTLLAQRMHMASSSGRQGTAVQASLSLLNVGRPAASLKYHSLMTESSEDADGFALYTALAYPEMDRATAEAAARRISQTVARPDTTEGYHGGLCVLEHWRVQNGDLGTVNQSIAKLRTYVAAHPPALPWLGACAYALDIAALAATQSPRLRAAVETADSAILHAPLYVNWRELLTLAALRGYQQLGDKPNALKLARRYQTDAIYARSTMLLERARLAAEAGNRDEAVESYQRYLKLRPNVEPGSVSEQLVARARDELAALVGEARR